MVGRKPKKDRGSKEVRETKEPKVIFTVKAGEEGGLRPKSRSEQR